MEQLEVQCRSYLIQWVEAAAGHTISWSVRPEKKSIQFGIFRHTESSHASVHTPPKIAEKLAATGLKLVHWHGTCDADQTCSGRHQVAEGFGGLYALVFDNTFSKQTSKRVTCFLMTFPSDHAPSLGHRTNTLQGAEIAEPLRSGYLQKRRRRKRQGWAWRYFKLDQANLNLSYYHDKQSSSLRGAIPLSVAAVACNALTGHITIDSGAEIWHLRAKPDDFAAWKTALDQASRIGQENANGETTAQTTDLRTILRQAVEETEALVKDSATLAPSMSPAYSLPTTPSALSAEQRPFWRRKPSAERSRLGTFKRSVSATPPLLPSASFTRSDSESELPASTDFLHQRCLRLLSLLEGALNSKPTHSPHGSLASQDDIFYDVHPGVLELSDDSEQEYHSDEESHSEHASPHTDSFACPAFPPRSAFDTPCSVDIQYRTTVPGPTVSPPSLIGFLRKNVGKDLSSIAMPVTANEPLSLLQRTAEIMESSELLDQAASAARSETRLTLISAFAVSCLAGMRCSERAMRKPFNPMLGETFELIRPGYRLLAEKVLHRPVTVACQAEGRDWTLTHSPSLGQRFWGKSAEITTNGKVRIHLLTRQERYSWLPPTTYLRNVIAGEKYVEPTGSIDILNESNGQRAVVSFKGSTLFSGRSEDLTLDFFDAHGQSLERQISGKWTQGLSTLWTVASGTSKGYGLTPFASSLNEITAIETGHMAPTDSRLRPDQRALENGDIRAAETIKSALEEAQRQRRIASPDTAPLWFSRVQALDGEEAWVQKRGEQSYWQCRSSQGWQCPAIFAH